MCTISGTIVVLLKFDYSLSIFLQHGVRSEHDDKLVLVVNVVAVFVNRNIRFWSRTNSLTLHSDFAATPGEAKVTVQRTAAAEGCSHNNKEMYRCVVRKR